MDQHCAIARMTSPVGTIEIYANALWIEAIKILSSDEVHPLSPRNTELHDQCIEQIQDWFAGTRRTFTLPLKPASTPRGAILRMAIDSVSYGTTATYGEVARSIRSSARAIGQACRTNPFPIIIPCHRIISTSGPEFYSAGRGLQTKAWFNQFERSMTGLKYFDDPHQPDLFS